MKFNLRKSTTITKINITLMKKLIMPVKEHLLQKKFFNHDSIIPDHHASINIAMQNDTG